ncbi:FxSxx-COOH system tetratricopeptide repeat protein [Streptomyces sp. NPDC021020]|uniref:FxSxx-COOH system tetratricopeptide repeat protein n=1 Tax=Streptomyces sp. NPDC021020 TaxID=3365109 RepID=UPI0037AF89BF
MNVTIRTEGVGSVAAHTMRDVTMYLPARAPVTWPHVVGVVPPRAGAFQDRAERARLREAVRGGGTAVLCQVLSGMGGVGKTQLAADLAEEVLRERGVELLVWLSAGSRTAIVAGLAQAGAEVCGADPSDPEQATRAFLAWLRAGPRRWLVVLDDIADPADVKGLWPPAVEHGRTVLTTRRRDAALAGSGRRLVQVGTFTPEEAVTYLVSALEEAGRAEPAAELAGLADDLGCLPLALSQAAAYIVDAGIPVAKYRDLLARRIRTLGEVSPDVLPDDQPHTMAAAWQLSVERADALRPYGLARPMLELASFLAPSIPLAVLTSEPAREHLAPEGTLTPDDAAGALRALHRLSLLTAPEPDDDNGGYVRVHQIVQRATRDTLPTKPYGDTARAAADALMAVWPDIERDTALAQSLRTCATALVSCTEEGYVDPSCLYEPKVHRLLHHAGRSLGNSGQVAAAVTYFQSLITAISTRHGPDRQDVFGARSQRSSLLGEMGDAAGAATALTALLPDMLRVLGPDHPETLVARSNLAHWQGVAGDTTGAATAYAELLNDMLRALGPDHPHTLTTRHNLALWQGESGDTAGAATAHAELLNDRLRILGPDHPHTLTTRSNLAGWRGEAGDATGAATAYAELLNDMLRALGPDHPSTLIARSNLAHWQGAAGDATGAATAYAELLNDRLRILGPDHPSTLTARHNLALWQGMAGDATGAATAYAELLNDRLRILGPDHPHTLITREELRAWRTLANGPQA